MTLFKIVSKPINYLFGSFVVSYFIGRLQILKKNFFARIS